MKTEVPQLPAGIGDALRGGQVIPAHPLALTEDGRIDEAHQRALTRYYLDAGVGGLAVGVHTTEFAIHQPQVGFYKPVLELAMETAQDWAVELPIMVAGIVGKTDQAVREAETARSLGYHVGMISMGALGEATDDELITHARAVAEIIPIMGFYLQPSVGGRILSREFWRALAAIPNLVAVKIAPFDRYGTLDVVTAIAEAGRAADVALYTGNDDSILVDLLTRHEVSVGDRRQEVRIVGGLLGHWAYWTSKAVEQLARCREARQSGTVSGDLLTLAAQVTESNLAVFDPAHHYRGCISGILYVLSRTGLVAGVHTLGEGEALSPGQREKIDQVITAYPYLTDEQFVQDNLERWLRA